MSPEPTRAVELRLRAAIESAPSGILMIDAGGTIVLVNREVERLFGYSREELLGRSIDMLVPVRLRGQHGAFRAEFLATPMVRAMGSGRDLHGVRKDGTEVPVEIGLTPVITEEGMFVVSAVVDISARKRAEEERLRLEEQLRHSQKMEAVGMLAGGIAHDFNNILAAIVGYADLAKMALHDRPEVQADVDEVLRSSEQGRQLVQRILTFSRRQPQQMRPLALAEPVHEALQLLRSMLPPKVRLQTRYDGGAPRVLADPTSVHQILVNLGTNAAHAVEGDGTIEITIEPFYAHDSFVRTHRALREGSFTVLTVRDTGTGMDRAVLDRVLEPFFTTKAPGTGTGLGLSIVHGIMRDHQGAIDIDSEVGVGTTVRCYFPALPSQAPEASVPAILAPRGRGERILYVDDDAALAEIGRRRLTTLGYTVTAESDSARALELVQARWQDFDLVITDYWMPRLTGLDLAAAIRRVTPALPVLMLTGLGHDLPADEVDAAGISRILRKPITTQQLGAVVAETLEARRRALQSGEGERA